MSEEELLEKMDDYLMGKLAPEAAQSFEDNLARHPEWQEELDLRRIEHEGMELLLEDKLRADMRRWDEQKRASPSRLNYKWLWGLALLLCAGALVFFMKKQPKTPTAPTPALPVDSLLENSQPTESQTVPTEKNDPPIASQQPAASSSLAITFAEKAVGDLDVSLGVRGDDKEPVQALADSIDAALARRDYRRLLQLSEKPPADDFKEAATLRYVRGWAFFKLGNFGEAEKTLAALASENHLRLKVKAQRMWMYALLAQCPAKAKALNQLLKEILGEPGHSLQSEAEAVRKVAN